MPADEFRRRVQHDVRAVLDGPAQIGRSEGIIDHQRNVGFVRNLGHRLNIEHVHARIADRLAVEQLACAA